MTATLYTDRWRRKVRGGARSSASALVPRLRDAFHPATMIDVGAGEGWFGSEFAAHGVAATTVDGPWIETDVTVDLSTPPYPQLDRYDLAICLEVAEHVPAAHAGDLVEWLAGLAPVVVFSAAIPGQGGTGHVNEQPPGYWADLFAAAGLVGTGQMRARIWGDDRIEPWYRQNLLVFADDRAVLTGEFGEWGDGCPYLVHPGIWHTYR